jgi:2-polyprenyl-3-methyl-5-hydroxy-6-metoxy-1,4-benzoquinol methylase
MPMLNRKIFSDVGNCNLCGNNKFEKIADRLRDTIEYKVYRCLSCDHIQLLPRPSMGEEKKFYDEDRQERSIRKGTNLESLRTNFKPDINRRAEFISKRFPKKATILDVGCGYGFFLEEMARRGYRVEGIEISEARRELAKEVTSAPILNINLADPNVEVDIEKIDVVTLFHVLEHIIDPIGFCRNVQKLLKKNGTFVVEVPNVDELMLETCPAYNQFYWNRAHLNYFSGRTLRTVLEKAGFGWVNMAYVQRYGIENLYNWLTIGKPQLEKPVLETSGPYGWLESCYREYLERAKKTDTLFAVTRT